MKRPQPFRRTLFTGLLLALSLASFLAAQSHKPEPGQLGAQIVAQGTKNGAVACARCHGFDGASDGSGSFPKLTGQSANYLADELHAYVSGNRKNSLMEPIAKGLNDEEIKAVAEYYENVRATSVAPRPQPSQLIARGEQLAKVGDLNIRVQACESCHGPNGRGEAPTVPYLAGQYSHYIILQIRMYRQGYRKTMQMMDPALNLPEQDVAALAAYFEQVSRPTQK